MRKFILLLWIGFLVPFTGMAHKTTEGNITGTVKQENGDPIAFANVFVLETKEGTTTDFDGKFTLKPRGNTDFHLIISFVGFKTDTLLVKSKNQTIGDIILLSNAQNLNTYIVEAKKNMESEAVLLMERKNTVAIEQSIGATELAKTGASDAASGLSKVVGLSVVGSKYVFVRGMGDRYNSVYLNGLPLASIDPDKKVIPLDLFPSSVIQSMSVRKTYSPELYGDFSGGAIDIRTKDYPEKATLTLNVGTGYNTQSTFKNFQNNTTGKWDLLGHDDGSRALPLNVARQENYSSNKEGAVDYAFANDLNPSTKPAPVNTSVKLYGGNFFKVRGLKYGGIGLMVLGAYNNDYSAQNGLYRLVNKQNNLLLDYTQRSYQFSTSSSLLSSLTFKLNRNHSIVFNAIGLNTSSDQSRETNGKHFDYEKLIFTRRYTYRENNLKIGQLKGSHLLLDQRLNLSWGASINKGSNKEPNRRQLVYLYDEVNGENIYQFNAIDRIDNHRFYSDLSEKEINLFANIHYKILWNQEKEYAPLAINMGYQYKDKSRLFNYRQFIFDVNNISNFYPEGINPNAPEDYINSALHNKGAFYVQEVANPASKNSSKLNITSYYINSIVSYRQKFQLLAGIRMEDGVQSIVYRDQQQPIFLRANVIDQISVLPSALAKYNLNDKMQMVAAFSKTITRPGFKEVAPFEYTEFFAGQKTIGNAALTNSENYNYDLKYEIYPSAGEIISVGVFYKHLINPIERTQLATASGQLSSYQNSKEARIAGVELEWVSSLGNLFNQKNTPDWLNKLYLGMNMTYLYSKIAIDTVSEGASLIQTNSERALQGASPYLINANLTYTEKLENGMKGSLTLSYNVFGRRIESVGILGIKDIYQNPIHTLNLIASINFKEHLSIGLSAKNILNPLVVFEQETISQPIIVNQYRNGTVFGFSITYNVFK